MIQEIIVFCLFAFVIGFSLYRLFFVKNKKPKAGCEKCAEFKDGSPAKPEKR